VGIKDSVESRSGWLAKEGGGDFHAYSSSLPSRTGELLLISCALQFESSSGII